MGVGERESVCECVSECGSLNRQGGIYGSISTPSFPLGSCRQYTDRRLPTLYGPFNILAHSRRNTGLPKH